MGGRLPGGRAPAAHQPGASRAVAGEEPRSAVADRGAVAAAPRQPGSNGTISTWRRWGSSSASCSTGSPCTWARVTRSTSKGRSSSCGPRWPRSSLTGWTNGYPPGSTPAPRTSTSCGAVCCDGRSSPLSAPRRKNVSLRGCRGRRSYASSRRRASTSTSADWTTPSPGRPHSERPGSGPATSKRRREATSVRSRSPGASPATGANAECSTSATRLRSPPTSPGSSASERRS